MKKSFALVLIAFSVMILTSCSDPYEEELRQMQETHDAISDFASDLGITLPEFGDITETDTTPDNTETKNGYSLIPVEALLTTTSGRNSFSGNLYFAEGMIMEIGTLSDGKEYILFLPFLEENDTWVNFAIAIDNADEKFLDYMFNGESIRFFFEYSGYSDEIGYAYGNFRSYEIYDPFA